ncbi:tail fiber assembly protein [Providencia rettgeri]|uniref:tail fiber assembly protein n=1 Tax=Providencia rettgeri TaxID=587 RepID=UPI0034E07FD7
MRYYKNSDNEVFAFGNDESPKDWLEQSVIEITESEAISLTQPSKEELISNAELQKQALLIEAINQTTPLQDAVDLGVATDKELMRLNTWKQYRVDLNRIDTSTAPDIDWPEKPE